MEFITSFISEYGLMILYALLTALAGFIGTQLKRIYENHINDETKEKVVATCVKAVEQLYHDLNGEEKLAKAKENIVAMLTAKKPMRVPTTSTTPVRAAIRNVFFGETPEASIGAIITMPSGMFCRAIPPEISIA